MSEEVWEYQVTFWRVNEMEADYVDNPYDSREAMRQLEAEINDAVGQGLIAGMVRVEGRKLSEYPTKEAK